MSATDELRRLLDERGVEHCDRETSTSFGRVGFTQWGKRQDELDGISWMCSADSRPGGGLLVLVRCDDFEQARVVVEATLGREQPPYDKLVEVLRRDWDIECSWDGLRRFWYVGLTDEGVRKRDEREATLGRGECHKCNPGEADWFVCSECGCQCAGDQYGELPKYCANCGAKVVGQ